MAIESICKIVKEKPDHYDLRVIKLEKSNINDLQVITFIDGLMKSEKAHVLQELSLAFNNISDPGAEKFAVFLDFNTCKLKFLNLHWN